MTTEDAPPSGARARDGLVLRARRADDHAAIADMMRLPGVVRGTLRLPFASDAFYREWIGDGPDLHPIVADEGGRLVGQIVLHRGAGRRAHVAGVALAVRDEACGRGVGTALLAAACGLADDWLGLRRLSLEVYADNRRAIALYERFGFVREGVLRAESLREGQLVDSVVMGRLREPPSRLETLMNPETKTSDAKTPDAATADAMIPDA